MQLFLLTVVWTVAGWGNCKWWWPSAIIGFIIVMSMIVFQHPLDHLRHGGEFPVLFSHLGANLAANFVLWNAAYWFGRGIRWLFPAHAPMDFKGQRPHVPN